jgi:rhodanese-related sulfurtransferase
MGHIPDPATRAMRFPNRIALIANCMKKQKIRGPSYKIAFFLGYFYVTIFLVRAQIVPGEVLPSLPAIAGNISKKISAFSCDSLIKANDKNPGFVILDVRTPGVWVADHLSGSINRNYYDADFSAQINALPKQKMYLLHCQSGGRSAPTLTLMKNLNFAEVYEMSGGISAWKAIGLPTTSVLAPRLMLVSNGGIKNGSVHFGFPDTLQVIITNRANDTLKFSSLTLPPGNEFTSNFDLKKKLTGAEDCSFSVFYHPEQWSKDSVHLVIQSNGGNLSLTILLKAVESQEIFLNSGWNIFSLNINPAVSEIKDLFQPLITDGSLVKIQDKTGNALEDLGMFGGWTNNIGNIRLTEGYKIKVTRNCQIVITGTPPTLPMQIPLNQGWNIIGFPLKAGFDGKEVVQQLIDRGTLIKVQDELGNSIEDLGFFGGWTNNIGNFTPGEGYKIKVSVTDILIIYSAYP